MRESALAAHRRLGQDAIRAHRARGARGGDRADRLRRGARAHRRAPGRGPAGVHRLGVARGDRRRRWPSYLGVDDVDRHPGRGRRGRPLHRRGGRSTPTGRTRPTAMRRAGRRATASTSPRPTPTPTRPPTCRCWQPSATRSPSTPTGSWSASPPSGWEVRYFVRPVRLRDRVSMPTPGRTAAISGGLAAIVAGVVVFWVLRHRPAPTRRERLLTTVRAQTRRTARPWGRAAQRRR